MTLSMCPTCSTCCDDPWHYPDKTAPKGANAADRLVLTHDRLAEMVGYWRERAEEAEAALARVEALAGEWRSNTGDGAHSGRRRLMAAALRAALEGETEEGRS